MGALNLANFNSILKKMYPASSINSLSYQSPLMAILAPAMCDKHGNEAVRRKDCPHIDCIVEEIHES